MERDSRMGGGHWRGCHTFKNITCDGIAKNGSNGRDGGLKMGGKYWYYVSTLSLIWQSTHDQAADEM